MSAEQTWHFYFTIFVFIPLKINSTHVQEHHWNKFGFFRVFETFHGCSRTCVDTYDALNLVQFSFEISSV